MPIAGIAQGLGIGGGATATISGAPGGGGVGFNIDLRDTFTNIVTRTGDPVGVIAFVTSGDNQYDILVFNGFNWQIYNNT
jgi:hypothetical protein